MKICPTCGRVESYTRTLTLSSRAAKVLTSLAKGLSNDEIADNLGITVPQIKQQICCIEEKFRIYGRVGLGVWYSNQVLKYGDYEIFKIGMKSLGLGE